jgi:hypothetical protein
VGVLTDAFVAAPDEVSLARGGPSVVGQLPAADLKGLDQVKLASLGQLILQGELENDGEGSYGAIYDEFMDAMLTPLHEFSDEEWVYPVPEQLTSTLADLADEDTAPLAAKWGETEEFELDSIGVEDATTYLRELKRLASAAKDSEKRLFLWMSL